MPTKTPRPAAFVGWLVVFVLTVAAHSPDNPSIGWVVLLNLVFFLLVAHATVLVHEAAHAAVARAVGLRPFLIVAGFGPLLVDRIVGGFFLRLYALPGGGATLIRMPTRRWLRLRLLPTYAAGFLANITVLMIVSASAGGNVHGLFWADFGARFEPLAAVFLANLWVAFTSLVPGKTGGSFVGKRGATDALQILSLPFLDDAKITHLVEAHHTLELFLLMGRKRYAEAAEGARARLAADPDDAVSSLVLAESSIMTARYAEARDLYLAILSNPKLTTARPIMANNIAWANLRIGAAALLAEADRLSAEAIESAPRHASIAGTRGAVLVELGRLEEAIPLLERAFKDNTSPLNRAYNACYLAKLEAQRGHGSASSNWIAKAKRLAPGCEMIELDDGPNHGLV